MATASAVAVGTLPATISGTVNLEVTDFGTPTAAIIFISNSNTTNQSQSSGAIGVGFWDGTNDVAVTCSSRSFVPTSESYRGTSSTDGAATTEVAGTGFAVRASVSSATNGITLTVTEDNTTLERYVVAVLIKGTSNAYLGSHTLNGTTSAQNITAPGFKPDLVFFAGIGSSSTNTTNGLITFGAFHNDSLDNLTQYSVAVGSTTSQSTSRTYSHISTSYCATILFSDAINHALTASDVDASGFSLTCTSTSTAIIHYLALEFPDPDDCYIGVIDSATGTGTQGYTGVGFSPDSLILAQTTCTSVNSVTGGLSVSFGACDDTRERAVTFTDRDAQSSTATYSNSDLSNVLYIQLDDATDDAKAAFSSFDSDGFTLNYSDGSASARKILAIAIGDSTAGGVTANPHNPFGHPFLGAFGGPI